MTAPTPAPDRRLTVVFTSVAYFMVALDALVVATALPSIHRDLGGSPAALQWTVNAYTLAFAAGIITASALGDRLGRRRVYQAGLAIFTAASASCALAPDLGVLIGFRAVQGIGAAIVMPLGLTLLTSAFPIDRRGSVVGIWGGIAGLGVAAGPLIGGGITQGLDWHWVFWVNVPIGLAAIIGARFVLAESYGPRTRLDLPGMALIASGVAVIVWALVQAPHVGWSAGRTIGGLAAGGVLVAGFVVREATAATPMIPLRLFRSGAFSAAALTQFFMTASIFAAAYLTSEFFQLARGDAPFATGLRFLPWTATPLLVAPVAGMLFDRIGARRLAVPGLLMQAAGFAWVTHLAEIDASYAAYVAPFIIAGVGISMALPSVPAAGMNALAPDSLGRAAGVLNTVQQLGAAVGVATLTAVFNANGSLASPGQIASGYRPAIVVAAGLSVLGAATAVGLRRTRPAGAAGPIEAPSRQAVPVVDAGPARGAA